MPWGLAPPESPPTWTLKLPFLSQLIAEGMWLDTRRKTKCGTDDVPVRRRTEERGMVEERESLECGDRPQNGSTKEAGTILDADKIASEWAGDAERSNRTERCVNAVDERDFLTLAMMSVQHSVAHRPHIGEGIKPNKEGSNDIGRQRNCVVTVRWAKKDRWALRDGTTIQKHNLDAIQKTLHSWWTRKVAHLVGMFADYAKHIFREHNQEADHLANLETEGQRKVTSESGGNTEEWKAVRGCWDGCQKEDGRSGCGRC